MHQTFRQHWLAVSRGKPGRRFQDRYAKARQSRADASWAQRARRFLLLIVALGAMVIGVFLMFLPGPAVLFYFIAGTLLAGESLYLARLMDWAEVRMRALWKWGKRHWAKTPGWGRAVVVTLGICLSVSCTYLSYRLFAR